MRQQAVASPDIRAGAQSVKGLREENQDAMSRFQSRFGEVILVADGMGGHQGGAVASDMVAKRFRYHLDAAAETTMSVTDALQQSAMRVNDEIYERGHSGDSAVAGMGSTLVVAVLRRSPSGQEVVVANAGDSRAYLVRDGMLRQLTRDHTKIQRMVDAGLLSPADARSHPDASVLSRVLGQERGITVETYPPVTLLPGDGLLLCSDGLSGYALDADIARAIEGSPDPNAVVRNLVELALNTGSDDNITVQFLRLGEKPSVREVPHPVNSGMRSRKRRRFAIAAAVLAVIVLGSASWMTWRWWHNRNSGPGAGDPHAPRVDSQTGRAKSPVEPQGQVDGAGKRPASSKPGQPTAEGRGASVAAPADTPKEPNKKSVMLCVPKKGNSPDWLPELKKHAAVRTADADTGGCVAPDKANIQVWYRPGAKPDFDKLAKVIPPLQHAKSKEDDSLPNEVDILIVMPVAPRPMSARRS